MRREGSRIFLDGAVTMDTVPGLLTEAKRACTDGAELVDFSGVTALDSAAIALALELRRATEGRVRFVNLPPAAFNLAALYSVTDQLGFAPSAT